MSPTGNASKLFLCSYVTSWNNPNCSEAVPVCTVPGPMFHIERWKPIEIAWVYDISNPQGEKYFSINYGPCMNNATFNLSKNRNYCTLNAKKKGY